MGRNEVAKPSTAAWRMTTVPNAHSTELFMFSKVYDGTAAVHGTVAIDGDLIGICG